eukprot:scaffold123359_cov32-Attheya_sp.AAC.1
MLPARAARFLQPSLLLSVSTSLVALSAPRHCPVPQSEALVLSPFPTVPSTTIARGTPSLVIPQCRATYHNAPASATLPFRPYPSLVVTNQARFYTYQPQPMGLNLSAFEWQSQLGHATIPPPLVVDPDDYNSDSSSVTNAMPHLSSPLLPGPPSRASA